jgi:hypothetical protein
VTLTARQARCKFYAHAICGQVVVEYWQYRTTGFELDCIPTRSPQGLSRIFQAAARAITEMCTIEQTSKLDVSIMCDVTSFVPTWEEQNMKPVHAVLIIAGLFFVTAYARADTILPSSIPDTAGSFHSLSSAPSYFSEPAPEFGRDFKDWLVAFDGNPLQNISASELTGTSTPEPSALFLVGSGLLALLGFSRIKSLRRLPWAS